MMKCLCAGLSSFILICLLSFQTQAASCAAATMAELKACVNNGAHRTYATITLTADVACSGVSCCPRDGSLVLNFDQAKNLVFDGGGHTITTTEVTAPGKPGCPLIWMRDPDNVIFKNVVIRDTGVPQSSCEPGCAPVIQVSRSRPGAVTAAPIARDVMFDNLHLINSPGSAITISSVTRFTFSNSSIQGAGVLGLYIGSISDAISPDAESRFVVIRDSFFQNVHTNGVALRGVGSAASPATENVIENNLFMNNHFRGAYMNTAYGKYYDGGQLYVPKATGLTVRANKFAQGYCAACDNPEVWGIEMGLPVSSGLFDYVSNAVISDNIFSNIRGGALFANTGFVPTSTMRVSQNAVVNTSRGLFSDSFRFRNTVKSGNTTMKYDLAAQNGAPMNTVYSIQTKAGRRQSNRAPKPSLVKAAFDFSSTPRTSLMAEPLWWCLPTNDPNEEFVSTRQDCAGQTRIEPLGFSFAATDPSAAAVYNCLNRKDRDRFLSWRSDCEGHVNRGLVGYAQKGR